MRNTLIMPCLQNISNGILSCYCISFFDQETYLLILGQVQLHLILGKSSMSDSEALSKVMCMQCFMQLKLEIYMAPIPSNGFWLPK